MKTKMIFSALVCACVMLTSCGSNWDYDKSPVENKGDKFLTALVEADEVLNLEPVGDTHFALVMRNTKQGKDVLLMGEHEVFNFGKITASFDGKKPQSFIAVPCPDSPTSDAFIVDKDAERFWKEVSNSKKCVISVYTKLDGEVSYTFNLDGFDANKLEFKK